MRKQFRNLVLSGGVMFVLVASWSWGESQPGTAMFNPKEYARAWVSEYAGHRATSVYSNGTEYPVPNRLSPQPLRPACASCGSFFDIF